MQMHERSKIQENGFSNGSRLLIYTLNVTLRDNLFALLQLNNFIIHYNLFQTCSFGVAGISLPSYCHQHFA